MTGTGTNIVIKEAVGFTDGEEGWIGWQYTPDDTTLFGWAKVLFDLIDTLSNFTVLEWAWDR